MANVHRVGDLEIDQDTSFERRMWTAQRVGWSAMALIVLAAVLGLFGGAGWLHNTAAGEPGAPLRLEYDRFARYKAPALLRVHVGEEAAEDGTVQLWLNRAYLEGIQIQQITPQPQRVLPDDDRLVYVYEGVTPGARTMITFRFTTEQFGTLSGHVGLVGGPSLSFTQFIYP